MNPSDIFSLVNTTVLFMWILMIFLPKWICNCSNRAFLIAIFAMTKVIMMTTTGYPFKFEISELTIPRLVGGIKFFIGIFVVTAIVFLSGWTKSKSMGIFTTIIGIITLVFFYCYLDRFYFFA